MKDLEQILESTVLTEENKATLVEAWNKRLDEAKEVMAAELREEFATRYDHDKGLIVEASDKFLREALAEELAEFEADRKAIREAKVKILKLKESMAQKVQKFVAESLRSELSEFRTERKQVNESIMKMQSFVQKQLAEEINEFAIDKKALVESRVEFEKNKREQLKEVKARFVESASKISEKLIRESLKAELTQLKTDLKESKRNLFGKRLFEAFASEFMQSHYNEGSQVKKLAKVLESAKTEIKTLKESVKKQENLLTEAKSEIKVAKELKERSEIMSGLLRPLNNNQRRVMEKLLESTATNKLQEGYKKYVSMVLKEDSENLPERQVLTENSKPKVAYDGHRQEIISGQTSDAEIIRLKKLSGIK